jgi:hypothetical protein
VSPSVERLLQQAQQNKRDAISALRAGETESAYGLLTGAMDQLGAPLGALDP